MATELKIVKVEQGLLAVLDNNVLSAKHFIEKEKRKYFVRVRSYIIFQRVVSQ